MCTVNYFLQPLKSNLTFIHHERKEGLYDIYTPSEIRMHTYTENKINLPIINKYEAERNEKHLVKLQMLLSHINTEAYQTMNICGALIIWQKDMLTQVKYLEFLILDREGRY